MHFVASAQTIITFEHYCDNKPIVLNTYNYTNEFNTPYQINQIQYFISDIAIHANGIWIYDSTSTYIDAEKEIPSIIIQTKKKKTQIDSIRFTFGLPKEHNIPYQFVAPEKAQMYWPEIMGSGYHYMKLNITYRNQEDSISLFNCHLGRSLNAATNIVTNNDFTITLPCKFQITKQNPTYKCWIRMNVEKWFSEPFPIDFNKHTKGIMGKQEIMNEICTNGRNVFNLRIEKDDSN